MRIAHKVMQSARSSRANSPIPSSPESTTVPLTKRIVDTVFGAKGGDGVPEDNKAVNPVSRLKLMLVSNTRDVISSLFLSHTCFGSSSRS